MDVEILRWTRILFPVGSNPELRRHSSEVLTIMTIYVWQKIDFDEVSGNHGMFPTQTAIGAAIFNWHSPRRSVEMTRTESIDLKAIERELTERPENLPAQRMTRSNELEHLYRAVTI